MNRSDPFEKIERFFDRGPFDVERTWRRDPRTADVDVTERDGDIVVVVDLPGYDRERIDVRVADGRITIAAERAETTRDDASEGGSSEGETGRYLRRERRRTSVSRTVDLPASVVEAEASATYRHGVLTVTLPKTAEGNADGRRIDVE